MVSNTNYQKALVLDQIHDLVSDCNMCEIKLDIIVRNKHEVLGYIGFDDLYEEECEAVFENEICLNKDKMSVNDLLRLREMIKQSMPTKDFVQKCKEDIKRTAFLRQVGLKIGNQAFVYKTEEGLTLEVCGLESRLYWTEIYSWRVSSEFSAPCIRAAVPDLPAAGAVFLVCLHMPCPEPVPARF